MKNLAFCVALLVVVSGCATVPVEQSVAKNNGASYPRSAPGQSMKMVSFHQARVKTDPGGAMGWAMLSEAYLAAASESDNDQLAIEAEKCARKSLELRTRNNTQAASALTKSLLAQHRFKEAMASIQKARLIDPASRPVRRLEMEIMLELGDYKAFKKNYLWLTGETDPASQVLKARWMSLTGQTEKAVELAQKALEQVEEIATTPAKTVAWYTIQFGTYQHMAGDNRSAEATFGKALALDENSHKALGWKAKLAFARGEWLQVVTFGEQARKEAKLTDIEGLIVQAKMKLGDKAGAEKLLAEMIGSNLQPGQTIETAANHDHKPSETRHTHDRLFAVTLADMGKHLRFAHHAAEEDLANRKDIYAEDAFAWSTYRYWKLTPASETGEGDKLLIEAKAAMKRALRTGSKDPYLLSHAELILGEEPK